jgi:HSP20 family protein
MMSAQKTNQPSTSQSSASGEQSLSRGEQRNQQSSLTRQSFLPSIPSLLLDPLGFFDDSPFTLMRGMQNELNRALTQQGGRSTGRNTAGEIVYMPPIEVEMQDGNFVVSAELPGVNDEDIRVEIRDEAVVISGERQQRHDETRGGVRRSELRYGQFMRAIPLPDGADPDRARAEFTNGVLRITVPVSQAQSNTRQIPVETGSSQRGQGQGQSAASQTGEQTKTDTTQKAA